MAGLQATGVLGLLLDAKQTGSIAAIRPALGRLHAHGFRIGPSLRHHILDTAGELPPPQPLP